MGRTTVITLRFLYGITIDKPMAKPIRIGDTILTTDKKLLDIFSTEFDPDVLGKAIRERFEEETRSPSNTLFALRRSEIEEEPAKDTINEENAKMLGVLIPYSSALWLQRDYSMEVQISYSITMSKDTGQKTCSIHPYPIIYYDAKGDMQHTSFTADELDNAVSALYRVISSQSVDKKSSQALSKSLAQFNRLNRTWLFVHAARIEHLLPYKLVNYVSCLECLLLRDTSELAHRIAERAGVLLGRDQASRMDWYRTIKRAYDYRSAFVHGSAKRCPDSEIEDLSAKCDQALRELMSFSNASPKYSILFSEPDEVSAEKFNNYFLEQLFREPKEAPNEMPLPPAR